MEFKSTEAIDESNFVNNFTNQINNGAINEAINSLNLSRVYFITTYSSASASELVMNSLSSYIDVKSVGATTRGKVHGSATLYDSDNFTRNGDNLNPNHSWAMQPLVLEIVNANGSNDPNGITPTVELDEDYSNLGTLGDRSDPLIDRTVILITTGSRSSAAKSTNFREEVKQFSDQQTFQKQYVFRFRLINPTTILFAHEHLYLECLIVFPVYGLVVR